MRRVAARTVLTDPVHLLAFGFGAGLAPRAPGTVGTLVGVVLWLAVSQLGPAGRVAAAVLAIVCGIWICGESARRLREHDHPGIVWDEIAGYWLTMLVAPPGWVWIAVGFGLFRLFDIWKPWPIRDLDHGLSGGIGIMLDDVIAGIYAALGILAARYALGS